MARRDSNPSRTAAGVFPDRLSAEVAIHHLKDVGFLEHRIGVARRAPEREENLTESSGPQTVVGLLAGIGGSEIPGIGPVVAGGALTSTLAGVGTAEGGLLGALVAMGIPAENARHFEQGFDRGGILLTVQSDGRLPLAREILSQAGGDLGPAHQGRGDDVSRSLDVFDRRRGEQGVYPGPERRRTSRR
jgi:hypothetical protein